MNMSFVILHYLTLEDTIECIDSIIQNVNHENYSIVVVDNGSPNLSGQSLKDKYNRDKRMHFILSKTNLGFAKGNNLGFSYAKRELNSDFIILINNDTIIRQRNFLVKIEERFNVHDFHILGPDIISLVDSKHQNPYIQYSLLDEKSVENIIARNKLFLVLNFLGADHYVRGFYAKLKNRNQILQEKHNIEQFNIKLHGSCLIFSPLYIKKYNGLYDDTFMYMEEDILFYISQKERLKIMYCPEIEIFHKEDSSTNAVFQKDRLKRRFIYKNINFSATKFLGILRDNSLYKINIEDN